MKEYAEYPQLSSGEDTGTDGLHEDQQAFVALHLARLGIFGLPDETYIGSSEGLLERLEDSSGNS